MYKKGQNIPLQTLKVAGNFELLSFLMEQKVRKSRSAIKLLLTHKQVKVNNKVISLHNYQLVSGDVVTIHKTTKKQEYKQLRGLKIIYEDNALVIINKEAGLLAIATDKEKRETAYSIISEYLKDSNPKSRVFVLHRLDRETSGLMMFAKNEEVQEMMQKNWDDIILTRSYIAVIEGTLSPEEGSIVSWLTEDKNYKMYSSFTDNGGQKAITHYRTLKTNDHFSLIELNLETGRKNQIRVHLQHVGHPIIGDKKYGSRASLIKRVALHANELVFVHPITRETLQFKSGIPEKMKSLLNEGS
jgi:pseudouridine synthase, RluA family